MTGLTLNTITNTIVLPWILPLRLDSSLESYRYPLWSIVGVKFRLTVEQKYGRGRIATYD